MKLGSRRFIDPRSNRLVVYIISKFEGREIMDSCRVARWIGLRRTLEALEDRGLFLGVDTMRRWMFEVMERLIDVARKRLDG